MVGKPSTGSRVPSTRRGTHVRSRLDELSGDVTARV